MLKKRRNKATLLLLGLLLAVAGSGAAAAAPEEPTAYVRGILDQVMKIQGAPGLDEKARGAAIHRIIGISFDFPQMAKDSLGSAYGRLSPAQRQDFTETFSYLFQDSYTRMVLKFLKKENINYQQERRHADRAEVDTAIVRPNETIPVTYLMHRASPGWILYDFKLDGVSIMENYRSQFTEAIQTKGFSFLMERMKQQRQGPR